MLMLTDFLSTVDIFFSYRRIFGYRFCSIGTSKLS
jgi:hypothetical protein